MRLIHTADWHLGRRLKGVDRTPELAGALDALLADAKSLEVDAVIVAGDLFEVPNPPAEAERVAYAFFKGLADAKIPAVVIAGNHDSPVRLDGVSALLALAGIEARGRPRRAQAGGLIAIDTPSGQLRVGALPFASERRLLSADDLWGLDDVAQRQQYRDALAYLMRDLAGGFGDKSVNILTAHIAMDTARLSHSEAPFYTRDTYSLAEAALPATAQYIALGHIHARQKIQAAAPTCYSGSLIQLDFGEAGEAKGYQLITVEPGRPAQVAARDLPITRPLVVLHATAADLDEVLEANRQHAGFLKVVVRLETPLVGLADRVRKVCPQTLVIEPQYPDAPARPTSEGPDPSALDPVEAFGRYYIERVGAPPQPAVVKAFESLYEELHLAPA